MKSHILFGLLFIFVSADAQDEQYTTAFNDSVLTLLLKNIPKSEKEKFKEFFNGMTDKERSFFYSMSLPVSSKKELIKNVDTNYSNINNAIILFKELVPSD